jgi:hypothetical protein
VARCAAEAVARPRTAITETVANQEKGAHT